MFETHSGHGELVAQSDTFWWEGGQVQHNQSEPKRKRQRVAKRSGLVHLGGASSVAHSIGDGIGGVIGDGTGDGDIAASWIRNTGDLRIRKKCDLVMTPVGSSLSDPGDITV
jgi:hypothetical protein